MKINDLIKYKWIYHQIFGDLLNKLIYKNDVVKYKDILKWLWYKDIDLAFSDEIEKQQFNKLTTIVFRFNSKDDIKNDTSK